MFKSNSILKLRFSISKFPLKFAIKNLELLPSLIKKKKLRHTSNFDHVGLVHDSQVE